MRPAVPLQLSHRDGHAIERSIEAKKTKAFKGGIFTRARAGVRVYACAVNNERARARARLRPRQEDPPLTREDFFSLVPPLDACSRASP